MSNDNLITFRVMGPKKTFGIENVRFRDTGLDLNGFWNAAGTPTWISQESLNKLCEPDITYPTEACGLTAAYESPRLWSMETAAAIRDALARNEPFRCDTMTVKGLEDKVDLTLASNGEGCYMLGKRKIFLEDVLKGNKTYTDECSDEEKKTVKGLICGDYALVQWPILKWVAHAGSGDTLEQLVDEFIADGNMYEETYCNRALFAVSFLMENRDRFDEEDMDLMLMKYEDLFQRNLCPGDRPA